MAPALIQIMRLYRWRFCATLASSENVYLLSAVAWATSFEAANITVAPLKTSVRFFLPVLRSMPTANAQDPCRSGRKVPKKTRLFRDLSRVALRFDLAPRRSPSARPENRAINRFGARDDRAGRLRRLSPRRHRPVRYEGGLRPRVQPPDRRGGPRRVRADPRRRVGLHRDRHAARRRPKPRRPQCRAAEIGDARVDVRHPGAAAS